MTALLPLALAALIIGTGTQLAMSGLAFFLATWSDAAPRSASIAGAIYAPFGLVALLLPAAAVPVSVRLLPRFSGLPIRLPVALLSLWLLAEAGTLGLRWALGVPTLGASAGVHLMLAVYCAIGAAIFCRRRDDATS
ncbi:MAG: hypothetical protein GC151_15940 [Betaproteobacteria bacterium]|nr:hypothetical protein [Betaproteobacteria bacterium]